LNNIYTGFFFGIITDILLKNPQYFKAKNNIQTPQNNEVK